MSKEKLKSDLLEFLSSHPAHPNAYKAFQNFFTENRHKRVKNFSHTIWEELEHLRLAQEDILRYMLDEDWKSPQWPQGYWPEAKENISDEEWENTLNGFTKDLEKIQEFVKNTEID